MRILGMTRMKVLVGCERSGIVRDAFLEKGCDAWSCDLYPSERKGPHITGDVLDILKDGWDLAIFHPPCTHLAVSGARWFKNKRLEQRQALNFVNLLLRAPIPKICLENPISIVSWFRKPSQIVHPWMFGDPYTKSTCLWLKNLPRLIPTKIVFQGEKYEISNYPKWMMEGTGEERARKRSRTFSGLANAMADQWTKPSSKIGFGLT